MKNKNKKRLDKGVVISIVGGTLLCLSAGVLLATNGFQFPSNEQTQIEQSGGIGSSIIENGVILKMLSSVENDDGSVTQVFTFSVTPSNATNQNVIANAKYKDGSDCSSKISIDVNNNEKMISVTCKSDFDQQIIVTVVSSANSSKTATITVDYEKKLVSIGFTSTVNQDNALGLGNGYNKTSISFDDLFVPEYSLYTIDKEYTYSVDAGSSSIVTIVTPGSSHQYFSTYATQISSAFTVGLRLNMKEITWEENPTLELTIPNAEYIWNYKDDNNWRSLLKEIGQYENNDNNYVISQYTLTATCNETNVTKQSTFYFKFSLEMDFSSFTVDVDSISSESTSIIF